jgi:1-acyl-sn-glycerol-3-phosphate acyltransferase
VNRRWPSRLAEVLYGAAAWGVMGLVATPCWLLVVSLPRPRWRWRATWATVHALSFCLRIPLKTVGEPPSPDQPLVVVANHESILDSFALVGVFPEPVVFVAGGDLATHPITGPFLRGLGATFVRVNDGTDRSSVRTVLAELAGLARAGHRLVFFPEGGLSPEPGLRRFQLGAFVVAGEAGKPVLPLAVVGTRDLLPPGARLPRRHAVEVRFGETLGPPPSGWRAAHEIARHARDEIEALLGDDGGKQ